MRTVFQGGAYSQFKRAHERRNMMLAWTMAAELPKAPLADALELLLLARDLEPARFDRGAPRFRVTDSDHNRFISNRVSSVQFQLSRSDWNTIRGNVILHYEGGLFFSDSSDNQIVGNDVANQDNPDPGLSALESIAETPAGSNWSADLTSRHEEREQCLSGGYRSWPPS